MWLRGGSNHRSVLMVLLSNQIARWQLPRIIYVTCWLETIVNVGQRPLVYVLNMNPAMEDVGLIDSSPSERRAAYILNV
jgi:hypothetical protein